MRCEELTFRACHHFDQFEQYHSSETDLIFHDPVGRQLVTELKDLRDTVRRMEAIQAEGRHTVILASLLDNHSPFSHYPKCFKLLLTSILAIHEPLLGRDLIRILFPRLYSGMEGIESKDLFRLNLNTVKYYKSENRSLVRIESLFKCRQFWH